MRTEIIKTLEKNFLANIEKHSLNIRIMLDNPIAIPEHTEFLQSIESELDKISEFQDKLEALEVVKRDLGAAGL